MRGVNRTEVEVEVEVGVEVRRNIKQMFHRAKRRQPWQRLLQVGNPAERVEVSRIGDADDDLRKIRSRVLNGDEFRELRTRFEQMARDFEAALARRMQLVGSSVRRFDVPCRKQER